VEGCAKLERLTVNKQFFNSEGLCKLIHARHNTLKRLDFLLVQNSLQVSIL
jgi:hypothetical protein